MEQITNPFLIKPSKDNTNNLLTIYRDFGTWQDPKICIDHEEIPLLVEALLSYERGLKRNQLVELNTYKNARKIAGNLRSDFNGFYRLLRKSDPGTINEIEILDRSLTEQLRLLFPYEVEYTKKVSIAVNALVEASCGFTDDCIYNNHGLYPFLDYNEFHYRNPQKNEEGHIVTDLSTLLSSCIDFDSFKLWVDDLKIGGVAKDQIKKRAFHVFRQQKDEGLSTRYIDLLNTISDYLTNISKQKEKDIAVIKALSINNSYTINHPYYFGTKELKNKIKHINKKFKNKQLVLGNDNGETKVICKFSLPF